MQEARRNNNIFVILITVLTFSPAVFIRQFRPAHSLRLFAFTITTPRRRFEIPFSRYPVAFRFTRTPIRYIFNFLRPRTPVSSRFRIFGRNMGNNPFFGKSRRKFFLIESVTRRYTALLREIN